MKICKSYKEFNKILRKYTPKYTGTKRSLAIWRKWKKSHYCWVCYRITTIQEADTVLKSIKNSSLVNLPIILNEFKENKDKSVIEPYEGILEGIEITDEDYYWMIYDKDNKLRYVSCVGKLEYEKI